MITPQPPRTIELLLASIGAEAEFRDIVIGDLAEEFADRAAADGSPAAQRWYYREAIRATPHLAYNSIRRLGVRGLWRRLGIAASAYTITIVASLVPLAMLNGVAMSIGTPIPWKHFASSPSMMVGSIAADVALTMFGGYVAAYLDEDAPLVAAGVLGMVWLTAVFAAGPMIRTFSHVTPPESLFPIWYRSIARVLVPIGTIAGGVVRVSTRKPARDGASLGAKV